MNKNRTSGREHCLIHQQQLQNNSRKWFSLIVFFCRRMVYFHELQFPCVPVFCHAKQFYHSLSHSRYELPYYTVYLTINYSLFNSFQAGHETPVKIPKQGEKKTSIPYFGNMYLSITLKVVARVNHLRF